MLGFCLNGPMIAGELNTVIHLPLISYFIYLSDRLLFRFLHQIRIIVQHLGLGCLRVIHSLLCLRHSVE